MKRGLILIVVSVIFLIGVVSAGFDLGEEDYNIGISYSPSENINGWINISFEDENIDSLISSNFGDSVELIDFLDENSAVYNCTPADCEDDYNSFNSQDMKSFSLGVGDEKVISFYIDAGNVNSIKEIKFDVTVSNFPSCINPLKIDILDDSITEWKSESFLSVYNCQYEDGTGCFDSSANTSNVLIDDTPFCEKIKLIEGGNFSLGAWVKKGTTSWYDGLLEMSLYDSGGLFLDSCSLPEPSINGGEISCTIKYDNTDLQEYYVCLRADDGKTTDYQIKKEEVEPCGFYAYPGLETEYHDYYIFAKSARFANIGEFSFNQEVYEEQGNSGLLTDYIFNYLDNKYNRDCSGGCTIPIVFKSSGNLDIFVLNATLDYSTGAGSQIPKHSLYDTSIEKSNVNTDFQKLDLGRANFSTPSEIDTHTFELKLNNDLILEEDIYVVALPSITNIVPNEVSALVPVEFMALLSSPGNLTYTWDFGDNTTKTSTTNTMKHTYSSIGSYQMKVVVQNTFGNSSKSVQITVKTPNEQINKTINNYKDNLNAIQQELDKLPAWVKDEFEEELGIDEIKAEIELQEKNYMDAFSDDDYVKIMNALLQIDIPESFSVTQSFGPSQIFISDGQLNLGALESMGAGTIEGDEESYSNGITNWARENLDITLESKTYSLYSAGVAEPLYSYIKVILNPKQDLGEVYFIVNGNSDDVKFNGYKTTTIGDDSGIFFSELDSPGTIEFLYPGMVSVGNFPVYVSPSFSEVDLGVEPGVCNFNKRCEKDLGENYKNCRSDCKPLGWVIFWFIILFIIGFTIYILLQEWYKRYYESHLFKSKNQLFNLINFMNNAKNQGMSKNKIFSNLKDVGWNGEQLNYAWNKLHGKRTGMWEIPIFKWVENRQVKRELARRTNSVNGSLKGLGKV